jgi:hypothetical protein
MNEIYKNGWYHDLLVDERRLQPEGFQITKKYKRSKQALLVLANIRRELRKK